MDLPCKLLGVSRWNFPPLYSPFLKKPAVRTKSSQGEWIKETGKRTCGPWILPHDQPSDRHKI